MYPARSMSLPVIGDESSMLRDAAERGDVNGVRHFLSRPTIDLASRGPFGRTALHCAAHAGHAVVVSILLADPRCDANLRDDDGRTPLWLACLMNHYDAVSAFIARSDKVDLSLGDSRGISPWDAAAGVFRINEPTRNLLLNALRNQELEMSVSGGGAMSSSRSSSLVRTPTLTLTTPSGPVPRSSSSLADPKESFRRAQQEDSFIKACHSGDMPAVETYLTSFPDADINGRGTQLITGFMAACEAGQSAIALRLLKDPRLLPNEVDAVGRSAFYMACERNHWSLVQALLPYQDKINVMLGVGKHGGAVSGASLASTASGSKNSLLRIIGAGGGPAVKLPQDAGDQTIKKMVKEGIKRKTELVQARLAEEARAAYIEEQYRQQQAALLSEIEALEAEEAMRQAEEDRRREQEFASKVRADQERRDREKMERRRQLEEAAERKRREEEAAVFAEMSRQEAERARQEAERRRRAEEASMLAEIERLEAEEAARQLLEAKKREEEFAARVLQDNLRRETERAARRQAMAEAAELQRRQEMAAEEARRKREAEKRDAEFRRQQQESERQAELDRRAADLARQEHELRLKEELFKVQEQLAQARIQRSLSASQESARSAGGGAANLSPKTPASGDSTLKNGSEQVVIAGGLSAPSPVGDSNNNGNSAGSARSGGSGNTANSNNPNLRKASSSGSQIPSSTSPHSPNLSHSKYWIEEKDVEVDRTKSLGKGGFAEVFRGKYLKFNDVAVKIMLDTLSDEQSRRFFEAEMKVWAELPAHDNIVPLLGYRLHPTFFVTKLYPGGSLKSYLEKHNWNRKLAVQLLFDAALGMVFLHSKNVIHSDLKAENVLIDEIRGFPVGKVADFGLAKVKVKIENSQGPAAYAYQGVNGATLRFAPPEYFDGEPLRKPSDVWTFGMMCYQVFAGGIDPYNTKITKLAVIRAVLSDERPTRPNNIPDSLWELMERCWQAEMELRPTFEEVAAVLKSIVAGADGGSVLASTTTMGVTKSIAEMYVTR